MSRRVKNKHSTGSAKRLSQRAPRVSWTVEDGGRLRKIREGLGITQRAFADRLRVRHSLISAWENGRRLPSSRLLWKIAAMPTLAVGEVHWLIGKTGADAETLEFAAADLAKKNEAPADPAEIVRVRPLTTVESNRSRDLIFSKSIVPNHRAVKYVRMQNAMAEWFGNGDLLLIDTSQRDLLALNDGAFVALTFGERPSDLTAGFLRKQEAGETAGETDYHLTLELSEGKRFLIGSSIGQGRLVPLREDLLVLGRVVGWMGAERVEEPEKK